MNAQQVFDKAARHLLTQRRKSHDIRGCRYRIPQGPNLPPLMCAVGPFIPDDRYNPRLEGCNVASGSLRKALEPGALDNLDLLGLLQDTHDGSEPIHWPARLAGIAAAYHLSADIVEALAPEGGDWTPLGA